MEKQYTKSEIFEIIDRAIKQAMKNKNDYISLNGYKHKDTLQAHDNRIAALMSMYSYFE